MVWHSHQPTPKNPIYYAIDIPSIQILNIFFIFSHPNYYVHSGQMFNPSTKSRAIVISQSKIDNIKTFSLFTFSFLLINYMPQDRQKFTFFLNFLCLYTELGLIIRFKTKNQRFCSISFLKRGWLRKGFQAGSSRSEGIDNGPGMDSKCSSWSMAASYSPTIT